MTADKKEINQTQLHKAIKVAMAEKGITVYGLAKDIDYRRPLLKGFLDGEKSITSAYLSKILERLDLIVQSKEMAISAERIAELCDKLENNPTVVKPKVFELKEVNMSNDD